ncbi:MAG: 1A family penicillin-binding protein [Parcubacteria group bacterium Gr01-1014_70]|nr:MAG: 1A family penicillin-binding protein [Parcubacteria group bacterium Gr01-1014_70]
MFFMRRKKKGRVKRVSVFLISLVFITAGVIALWISSFRIPDLAALGERRVSESTKIYDRTGEVLLYDLHRGVKRSIVPFEDISDYVKKAAVALEDAGFYEHNGIEPKAIARAVLANLGSGSYGQGGSTITQQVVKNSLLTGEKKISRKLKEWVLALKLEKVLTKNEILALYFNEAPYGGNIYGIEEASRAYFNKPSHDLTLAESAYLAALPNAPTYFSPYGTNRARLEERKNLALARMREAGYISEEEFESAQKEKVTFIPMDPYGIRAPHFTLMVRDELIKEYGEGVAEEGLRIITTLDWRLQELAEKIVKKHALENEEKFSAENASLVAIDPKTGEVLALVGSRDYFDPGIDGNFNVAIGPGRQPGSAFKPFAYAEAFIKGYTPDTAIFDLSTQFSALCDAEGKPLKEGDDPEKVCYAPQNYDEKFRGPITMREALAQSINVPSVKTLYLAGQQDTFNLASLMGISTLTNANQYGLTLVLGGGEAKLLEMTGAYAVFANQGEKNEVHSIKQVLDSDKKVIFEPRPNTERVLPEAVALQISDVLSDDDARAPAFGVKSYLYVPGFSVAAKTGTTNDYKDAWIMGYSPTLAVGAWAGNNDAMPMEKKVAGFIVAPLWNEFMREALPLVPREVFPPPPEENKDALQPVLKSEWRGGKKFVVDRMSGKLATEYTPAETREERVVREVHSILYWLNKNEPRNGIKPANPEVDQQFVLWETPVRKWAEEQKLADETDAVIPTSYDDIHKPEFAPTVSVSSPVPGASFNKNERVFVAISSAPKRYGLLKAELYINGVFTDSTFSAPFSFSFIPKNINNITETNELKVVVYDSVLNRGEAGVSFSINE